jgi:hypothetical protein
MRSFLPLFSRLPVVKLNRGNSISLPSNNSFNWASKKGRSSAGEDKWIFPYQEYADAMFNSALLFELAVLKDYAEPILRKVPNNCPAYSEAHRLLRFLAYFVSVQDNELPPTSLLREFLGGSSFRY